MKRHDIRQLLIFGLQTPIHSEGGSIDTDARQVISICLEKKLEVFEEIAAVWLRTILTARTIAGIKTVGRERGKDFVPPTLVVVGKAAFQYVK